MWLKFRPWYRPYFLDACLGGVEGDWFCYSSRSVASERESWGDTRLGFFVVVKLCVCVCVCGCVWMCVDVCGEWGSCVWGGGVMCVGGEGGGTCRSLSIMCFSALEAMARAGKTQLNLD